MNNHNFTAVFSVEQSLSLVQPSHWIDSKSL